MMTTMVTGDDDRDNNSAMGSGTTGYNDDNDDDKDDNNDDDNDDDNSDCTTDNGI